MNIKKLQPGHPLMWDPGTNYPGTNDPIIYPATIGEMHHSKEMIRVFTPRASNFMSFDQPFLREPTEEELEKYKGKWPEIRLRYE